MSGQLQSGQSFSAIAARFGEGEVSRVGAKYRKTGNIKDLPRSSRPKVTTEREDKLITRHCRRHHFKPARQIRDDLQSVTGRMSRQTIDNRVPAANLPSRRPRKKPELTQQYHQAVNCNMPGTIFTGTLESESIHADRREKKIVSLQQIWGSFWLSLIHI